MSEDEIVYDETYDDGLPAEQVWHLDRDGTEITIPRWNELWWTPGYRIVAQTQLTEKHVLSTAWMGVTKDRANPRIFESYLFAEGHPLDTTKRRYNTEREALFGHAELVAIYELEEAFL